MRQPGQNVKRVVRGRARLAGAPHPAQAHRTRFGAQGGVRKCSPPSQPYKPEYELSRVTLKLRTDALPTPCRQVLQLPRMSGMAKIFGLALESEIASLTDI